MSRPEKPPDEIGEYLLIRPLGRGSAGLVYLARDTVLKRPVAIKFISRGGERWRRRFLIEAQAIARLQHPNIVTIYRVGERDDWPYLVQEYIRGTGLHELDRPIPGERVAALGRDIARGLAAAHRRGVLHRDIKPANIIVTESGEAKVVDFGLAKLLHDESDDPAPAGATADSPAAEESDHSELLGTPYYMAPEIWRGEPAMPASDVYSLAVVLYELCAGHVPHHDVRRSRLDRAVAERDAPPLGATAPDVDTRLCAIYRSLSGPSSR